MDQRISLEFRKTIASGEGERIWKLYGFSCPEDLVLEDVAFAMGILVFEGKLDGPDARMVRQGKRGIIRVNQEIPEAGRKRFAIAHEMGHWVLHQDVSQLFACTSQDMVATYRESIHEAEASSFASGLLMPRALFAPRMDQTEFAIAPLMDLGSHFGTSLTATTIRYLGLTEDPCAIVISENGRIRWWRGSDAFEERFWLQSRAALSRHTLAGRVSLSMTSARPEEVDIEAWSERGAYPGSDTFVEESVYQRRYGQVLTLLRLP